MPTEEEVKKAAQKRSGAMDQAIDMLPLQFSAVCMLFFPAKACTDLTMTTFWGEIRSKSFCSALQLLFHVPFALA